MYLHDTEGFSARVRRTKRRQGWRTVKVKFQLAENEKLQ